MHNRRRRDAALRDTDREVERETREHPLRPATGVRKPPWYARADRDARLRVLRQMAPGPRGRLREQEEGQPRAGLRRAAKVLLPEPRPRGARRSAQGGAQPQVCATTTTLSRDPHDRDDAPGDDISHSRAHRFPRPHHPPPAPAGTNSPTTSKSAPRASVASSSTATTATIAWRTPPRPPTSPFAAASSAPSPRPCRAADRVPASSTRTKTSTMRPSRERRDQPPPSPNPRPNPPRARPLSRRRDPPLPRPRAAPRQRRGSSRRGSGAFRRIRPRLASPPRLEPTTSA